MDILRLKAFFLELIKLGINHPGIGNEFPCPRLLEDMVMHGEGFVKRIIGDYSNESQEYRLNLGGLKLNWRIAKAKVNDNEYRRFECCMAGDQLEDFPTFTIAATNLIIKEGFEMRR